MNRKERFESINETLLVALQGWQANLWTALPGIIQSFDPKTQTASIQPTIQAQFTSPVDGSQKWVNLPLLGECPVFFPQGGGYALTFPVQPGNECLIVFASRCIDSWWQDSGIQPQSIIRMHDLSDGFAFVGFNSVPKVIPNISTNSVQLRTFDGATKIDLKAGTLTLTAANIVLNGNVQSTGTFTNNGKNIGSTHEHGGVSTGSGNTGVPT